MAGTTAKGWALASLLAALLVACGGRDLLQDGAGAPESDVPESLLADSLGLEITLTTPGDLAKPAGPIAISGSQPLTVVYSRSVVPLGAGFEEFGLPANRTPFTLRPAVEGRLWWVTTYIARFDPEGGWPSDLEVEFQLNEELTTFDGVGLSLGDPEPVVLLTDSLDMSVRKVSSEEAKSFTSGLWDASVGREGDKLPEVPPDGVIELEFSHEVALELLDANLKVKRVGGQEAGATGPGGDSPGLKAVVQPCGNAPSSPEDGESGGLATEETTCAVVRIDGEIQADTLYALFLEEGAAYTRREGAGRLRQAREVRFAGLRPFRIPFVAEAVNISSPVLDMWLPHGLESPEEALEVLRSGMVLTSEGQSVNFTLELPNDGTLRLNASGLQPLSVYQLSIPADLPVVDRYGQPLLPSGIDFDGAAPEPFFFPLMTRATPPLAYFERDHQDWTKEVVTIGRGPFPASFIGVCGAPELDIFKIEEDDINAVLDVLQLPTGGSVKEAFGEADMPFKVDVQESGLVVEAPRVPELFEATGLLLHETCRSGMYDKQVMAETDVQVSIVSAGLIDGSGEATVWVTSMSDGTPVEGVEVLVFSTPSGQSDRALLGNATTDAEGLAIIPIEHERVLVVVKRNGKYLFLPRVNIDEHATNQTRASLVLDRKLVRPGETLHVKGYVMEQNGSSLSASSVRASTLSIIPPFNQSESLKLEDVIDVQVDDRFGTFEVDIPIPEDAPLTNYRVEYGPPGGAAPRPSDVFRVGDPRPPTVDLSLTAPFWASPEAGVQVQVEAVSFIGAAVSDASMTLRWGVFDSKKEPTPGNELLTGELEFTTNETGVASPIISFEELPPPGTILDVTVQWVGPTREVIEKKAFVKLELANLAVDIERTVSTDFPGQEFGVRAAVSTLDGVKLESAQGVPVLKSVSVGSEAVRKREPISLRPLDGEVMIRCNSSGFETCRMVLPGVGLFAIEVCIDIEDTTQQVCHRDFLGRTQKSWFERPLIAHPPVGLVRKGAEVARVGEEITFLLENPFENAHALMSWGSTAGERRQRIQRLDNKALVPLTFEVDDDCSGNCGLSVVVAVPRQGNFNVIVPVSKLFDATAPHTVEFSESVTVEQDRNISVAIAFPGAQDGGEIVVAPRSKTNITLELSDCRGLEELQDCPPLSTVSEVTIIAVDQAVLDVVPMPLKSLSSEFLLDLAASFNHESTSKFLIAPGAVTELLEGFTRHQELDPWSDPVRDLTPSFLTTDLDKSDEKFLASRAKFITLRPEVPVVLADDEADVEPETTTPRAEALGAAAEAGPGDVRIQAEFVSTPLFATVVSDESGLANVEFEAPDNLGTFVVRGYATSGTGLFGSGEAKLIVRKALSLTPSAPRFVRVNDKFEAGVIVTVVGGKEGDEIRLQLDGGTKGEAVVLTGEDTMSVKLDSDNQVEARFEFTAQEVGEARIVINAEGGDGIADSLELTIPVKGQQERVVLATSFSVAAPEDGTESFQQLLDLPQAVPGSGSVGITAGVGRLATVLSLTDMVIDTNPEHECPISVDFALALSVIPAVLQKYDLTGATDSEALGSGLDESVFSLVRSSVANLSSAVDTLTKLTNPETGLQPWLRCSYSQTPTATEDVDQTISIARNADGIWLVEQAVPLMLAAGLDTEATQLEGLAEYWRDALAREIVDSARAARKDGKRIDVSLVIRARWALGAAWSPPKGTNARVANDLSMDRAASKVLTLSVEDQARFVLATLEAADGEADENVQNVLEFWTSNLRVGSRTVYISDSEGSEYPASTTGNALALLAFARGAPDTPQLDRLANFVGSAPAGVRGFGGFDALEKAFALWAIGDYDLKAGSATPEVTLVVKTGKNVLLNESFGSAALRTVKESVSWEELKKNPEPLEFQVSGAGEVTLAVTLMFVPRRPIDFPTFQGILVEQSIQMTDSNSGNASSPPLSKIPLGSVVAVTLQVTNPDLLGGTMLRALMPGGLEPIDPASESFICPLLSEEFPFAVFSCAVQETRPDVVTFQYNELAPGTQAVTFRAVAATVGTFSLPPVRAFVIDQPEVMGMSAAGSIEICSGENCEAEVQIANMGQMKACPNDCSGLGLCNLEKGKCLCFDGYSGEACEDFVVT
ncbi:unnamed protein product [Ostreobium quekettii]|uniref:EGF-like domain-containing protein n=1 Tax=Ostreobium quekettii TaxID=121088 RepID=A0A8S1J4N8_9CHLO|nr:unnamed protein product [Ostreobium quekettii]